MLAATHLPSGESMKVPYIPGSPDLLHDIAGAIEPGELERYAVGGGLVNQHAGLRNGEDWIPSGVAARLFRR
jgi:hypothetical protein